ncbi:AlpA family phage regulatory protein [Variovorax sp. J22G73]|uniref:helix-turn-helix transcriptional regulator n=1 Tax=unclassified Variovorax TaxID=663243 RepID=UPI00257609C0|nr:MULTISPECIES: AlpA family phage regulatory protein [unclassified Variovorax]MDM0007875.1 AlpA family phage regulatory protein [Variovorax sp. J22R203]MDM0100502.1 AlpA family phage regulatory protein [Variovorax sp. J22G73]
MTIHPKLDEADALAGHPAALLRCSYVTALTGLSRSTLYAKIAVGTFPEPVRLGPRCSRWRVRDVAAWLDALEPGRRPT